MYLLIKSFQPILLSLKGVSLLISFAFHFVYRVSLRNLMSHCLLGHTVRVQGRNSQAALSVVHNFCKNENVTYVFHGVSLKTLLYVLHKYNILALKANIVGAVKINR